MYMRKINRWHFFELATTAPRTRDRKGAGGGRRYRRQKHGLVVAVWALPSFPGSCYTVAEDGKTRQKQEALANISESFLFSEKSVTSNFLCHLDKLRKIKKPHSPFQDLSDCTLFFSPVQSGGGGEVASPPPVLHSIPETLPPSPLPHLCRGEG